MIRNANLILTFASGEKLFNDPSFWIWANTAKRIDIDVVVLSHNIPDLARKRLWDMDIEVEDVDLKEMHSLYRDRHLAYWRYLINHGHKYKYILTCDCRDVVFQLNPFDWVSKWMLRHTNIQGAKTFLDHFVIMTAEGHKASQSGFACVEHFEFERDIPDVFKKENKDKRVVNGGIFLGTPRAMQDWHFLVWTTCLKTRGRCTDQAAVNWLIHFLEEDETYSISFPQHDNLCLTGEGVKEGVEFVLKDGLVQNKQGETYHLIHQWDRVESIKTEVSKQAQHELHPSA